MIFLLHTDPNLVTYLSPMLLHDPVAKVKASASYGTHLQAHDRTAGTPDEREVIPDHSFRKCQPALWETRRRVFLLMQFMLETGYIICYTSIDAIRLMLWDTVT